MEILGNSTQLLKRVFKKYHNFKTKMISHENEPKIRLGLV